MRVLVTGGAGFIGSHIVDALMEEGVEVAILDHLRRAPRPWVRAALGRGAHLHVADVRDLDSLDAAFRQFRPQAVLHLAAQIDVRRSVDDPSTDAFVNIGGTAAVLEAARRVGARRLVLASTAGVYGDPEAVPTTEASPIASLSPYGTSKAAAEWYLRQYSRLHGMSTMALRMSNVYGPRQDSHGGAGVIAIFCEAAARRHEVVVYGDGRQTRDYVYVDDVVAAWLAAARSDATGVLNVSTGTETSVLDLAAILGVRHRLQPGRPGEIARSCLDPAAARHALGWRAATRLEDGLMRMLQAAA